ncbi:Monocarboxylate transporter 4 [Holothuria leucospilota]|uniref:Monocarboxylate transporter 4 n=1 Tax=Holothuria leucospilota TaxID=206669 RepID=A0A9Q1CG50_HOLLE|nr:Monocarboxylate transporter 4 [Holothuria leucospilota]
MKANGVILPYVVEKLQTSHTLVAWAFTLQCSLGFLINDLPKFLFCEAPLSKQLLHYFSYRQLGIVGGFLAGFGYIGSGLLTSSILDHFLFHSMSGFGFGLLCIPSFMYIHAHVDYQTFAKIQSTAGIFIYVGVAILPLVMKWLIDIYGHNDGLAIFGALIWNCVLTGVAMRPTESSSLEIESTSCSTVPREKLHVSDKYLPLLSPLFRHRNFAICMLFVTSGMYVYSSWAIFLVSFGNDLGFSSQQSVYLSTAGGVGGAVGSLLPLVLFSYNKMNAYTTCLFPSVANGITLLLSTFMTDFTIVFYLMLLSGFIQGFQYAGICGFIPLLLCEHHLGYGAVLYFLVEGVLYQFGGLLPGIAHVKEKEKENLT